MTRLFALMPILLFLEACSQQNNSPTGNIVTASTTSFKYDSLNTFEYFAALITNHQKDFANFEAGNITNTFNELNISVSDSMNERAFYTIDIIHRLLTSTGAINGRRGEIMNIPYIWHWSQPNPRHEILYLPENKMLKDMKPPGGYGKYRTYADIDRTPYLFISELLSIEPKFELNYCGKFHTFGWCSEREMAFTCLMESLGFRTHVIVAGNHCWSEVKVMLNTYSGKKPFIVRVDNTFNEVQWSNDESSLKNWNNIPDHGTAKWYNDKAHDVAENKQLKSFMVDAVSCARIEQAINEFLDNN